MEELVKLKAVKTLHSLISWTSFLSGFGIFVSLVLTIIGVGIYFLHDQLNAVINLPELFEGKNFLIGVLYVVLGLVLFLPFYFLSNSASCFRSYLKKDDERYLGKGLKRIKSFFKTLGIILIGFLVLQAIAFFVYTSMQMA